MNKKIIIITGPSGAGKSTLLNNITENYAIAIPKQVTTRQPRDDDDKNYYRYISINEFERLQMQGKFAITSGKHERRYGFLKCDIMKAFEENDTIALMASYKDVQKIQKINVEQQVVLLTFSNDIEKWVEKRIKNREKMKIL